MSTKLVKKDSEFAEVLGIIRAGRAKAYKAVNVALIDTYWAVGAHLSSRVAEGSWAKGWSGSCPIGSSDRLQISRGSPPLTYGE